MRKAINKGEIIKRFYNKHGKGLYSLDLTSYTCNNSVVVLECKEHGKVKKQLRYLMDIPCLECKKNQTLLEKFKVFKERANIKFGDRFDYNSTVYKGVDTALKVYCKTHDKEFSVTPYNHLKSLAGGCRGCAEDDKKGVRKYTTKTIIDKFKEVHGDKYNYENVRYTGITDKVEIFCYQHGVFSMSPDGHLQGYGCFKCGREDSAKKQKYTYLDLVNKMPIRGGYYMVCLDGYKNQRSVMKSKCPIHGIFNNSIASILIGNGCPSCANKKSAKTRGDHPLTGLYLVEIKSEDEVFIKVGCSHDVNSRILNIKTSLPKNYEVNLIKYYSGFDDYNAYTLESQVLITFKEHRGLFPVHFIGHTECLIGVTFKELDNFITTEIKRF